MYQIIRQSIFSSHPGTKLMYNVVKGSVKAERAGLKGSLKLREYLFPKSKRTEAMRRLVRRKTRNSLSHEASRRTASEWSRSGIDKKLAKARLVVTDTGAVLDKGISVAARNPITAITNTVGTPAAASINPALAAAPIGTTGAVVEKVAKKSGSYKKLTRRLGKLYDQSELSNRIRKAPSIVDIGNTVSRLPIPGITL